MEWTVEDINRLYALYERYFERLRTDIIATNRSLGSSTPEKTGLERLTRRQFESLLVKNQDEPEASRAWLRRITLGYETEFPGLHEPVCSSKAGLVRTPPAPFAERRRATGT
jgi:hypothetical protein